MENLTERKDTDVSCPQQQAAERCMQTLRMLTGKWKNEILWNLVQRKLRFGELRRAIPGITQHMLTTQLRELEADGFVRRTAYAELPLRVEYEMTPAAEALLPIFEEVLRWTDIYGRTSAAAETEVLSPSN